MLVGHWENERATHYQGHRIKASPIREEQRDLQAAKNRVSMQMEKKEKIHSGAGSVSTMSHTSSPSNEAVITSLLLITLILSWVMPKYCAK